MDFIKTVLAGWFNGPGNKTPEAGRFLWFASVITGLAYAGVHLIRDQVFNIIEFGAGMGSLLALGGVGIAQKDKGSASAQNTTPPSPPEGGQP